MLKKRMLLLVAAVAAFGAVMVGQVFATINTQSTSNNSSTSVGNYTVEGINLGVTVLNDSVAGNVIPPTGVIHKVGHVNLANFTSYAIEITDWNVTNYNDNGQCGSYGPLPAGNGVGALYIGALSPVYVGPPATANPFAIQGNTTASIDFGIKIGPSPNIGAGCQFNAAVIIDAQQII